MIFLEMVSPTLASPTSQKLMTPLHPSHARLDSLANIEDEFDLPNALSMLPFEAPLTVTSDEGYTKSLVRVRSGTLPGGTTDDVDVDLRVALDEAEVQQMERRFEEVEARL